MDACFCGVAFWSFGWAIGFGDGSQFIGWKNPSEKLAIFDGGDQVRSHSAEPKAPLTAKGKKKEKNLRQFRYSDQSLIEEEEKEEEGEEEDLISRARPAHTQGNSSPDAKAQSYI